VPAALVPDCGAPKLRSLWGGLAARAFDFRLDGLELNSQAALLSSDWPSYVHLPGLAGRSGLVQVYLAAGESRRQWLIMTITAICSLGHGLLHLSCSA